MAIRLMAICAIVVAAPFEPRAALIAAGPLSFTVTEIVWMLAAAMWSATWVVSRRWPVWRSPITIPVVCWVGIMAMAALVADAERANAVKATGRLTVGLITAWMVATSAGTVRATAIVIVTAAVTGLVVAVAALGEVAGWPGVLDTLEVFRDYVRLVGGDVRASGTLQYPTITAAYLEIVLALCIGLCAWLATQSRIKTGVVVCAVLVLSVGIALTLTRAAILASLAGAIAAGVVLRRRQVSQAVPVVLVVSVALLVPPLALSASETARLRWTSEGRAEWYRADFAAPTAVSGPPDAIVDIPVVVTNTGRRTWSPGAAGGRQPFHLSYHLVDAFTARVIRFDGVRTSLPHAVPPGARVDVTMRVRLPDTAGEFRIAWDVVQEERLWFGAEPGARTTFTRLTAVGPRAVGGPPVPAPSTRAPAWLETRQDTPGRTTLWRAAVAMLADHPWFGVGPDNFRLRAEPYLPGVRADPRVHTNNMYLEVFTGGGLPGGVAFLVVVWLLLRRVAWHVQTLPRSHLAVYSGVVASVVAMLTHGLLDSFFTFTPTVLMGGVVAGLAMAPEWGR